MKTPTDHTTAAAARDSSGALVAAKLRRLHRIQVVFLAVAAALSVGTTVGFLHALSKAEYQKNVMGDAVFELHGVFDQLRDDQIALLNVRSHPESGLRILGHALSQRASMVRQQSITGDLVDERTRSSARLSIETLDRAVTKGSALLAIPVERRPDGFEALRPISEQLRYYSTEWLGNLNRRRVEIDHDVDVLLVRARDATLALVALLCLSGGILWWLVGRARQQVVNEMRGTLREQAAVGEIATSATWAQSGNVAEVGAGHLADLVDADAVAVRGGDDGDELLGDHALGTPSPAASVFRDAVRAQALALNESLLRFDAATGVTVACVPAAGVAAAWGDITALWSVPGRVPPDAVNAIMRVGGTLDLALQSAQARERLSRQTVTDTLTSLPNHRAFQERLAEEVATAQMTQRPLSLVLLDVDAFSNVNDAYGHEEGDRILATLGQRLRELSRGDDTLARIGGDEFAWLMPGVEPSGAEAAATRALAAVRSRSVGMASQMTVSAGIVEMRFAHDPKEFLRLAENALRQAKSAGHDSVVHYRPGLAGGDDGGDRFGHLQSLSALRALARAVDLRDDNTQRHSERVAALVHRLAIEMEWPPQRATRLKDAALVHDVGKVGVPDAIPLKPGRLTDAERLVIETHPTLGARIVSEILDEEQVRWVRGHHERIDGLGYPDGLAGGDVPDGARLMAVADTWDAMTSDRPYRKALDPERALEIAVEVAGSQLDADAVAALVRLYRAGADETRGHDQRTGIHHTSGGRPDGDAGAGLHE